jgi:hypothetical protein
VHPERKDGHPVVNPELARFGSNAPFGSPDVLFWLILLAIVIGVVVQVIGVLRLDVDSRTLESPLDSDDDDDSFFHDSEDDLLSLSHDSGMDWSHDDDWGPRINPANGLPMLGSLDIEGNPYGCSSSHESMFDHFSGHDSAFDSWHCHGSGSGFDDWHGPGGGSFGNDW